jgi:hypothetical protein
MTLVLLVRGVGMGGGGVVAPAGPGTTHLPLTGVGR